MRKAFAIRTEPHEAEIGDTVLRFVPEAVGDMFVEQYANLRETQKGANADDADAVELRKATQALRDFLIGFMLPESHDAFTAMQLPTRVLMELLEWVAELYGGGAGGTDGKGDNEGRPTGPSSASPRSRRTPGTPSKAN